MKNKITFGAILFEFKVFRSFSRRNIVRFAGENKAVIISPEFLYVITFWMSYYSFERPGTLRITGINDTRNV